MAVRPADITAAIARVVGALKSPLGLHEPDLSEAEAATVAECVESGWVSYGGRYVDEFEDRLSTVVGGPVAATVNGTAALELALVAAGVRPGDEVLVPAFTFAATAAAVVHAGGVPHFVDIEPERLGVDPIAVDAYLSRIAVGDSAGAKNKSTGRPIRALVAVHVFGHPCELAGLADVAGKYGLILVEDAAESLGSRHQGTHTGLFGAAGAFSFNGNKIVTTGGGGAVVSRDADLLAHARHLSTTAKIPHAWEYRHDAVGYNYRMPALNAALGCAQLDRLGEFLAAKRELAERYSAAFAEIDGVSVMAEPPHAESNYWLNALILPDVEGLLEDILAHNHAAGYRTRPAWTPLHTLAPYADCPRMELPETGRAARTVLNVPSSAALGCRR
ncbi:MAG: LegC family aminotransferase [Gemmatimonadota bacterium]